MGRYFFSKHRHSRYKLCIIYLLLLSGCNESGTDDLEKTFGKEAAKTSNTKEVASSQIESSTDILVFGPAIANNENLTKTVTIQNNTSEPYVFQKISLKNSIAAFSIELGTCPPNNTVEFGAGASCTLNIKFQPTTLGEFNDSISILYSSPLSDSAKTLSIALIGSGVSTDEIGNSALSFSPTSKNFGARALDSTVSETISITSKFARTIHLSEFASSNSNFTPSGVSCLTMNEFSKDATCNFTVTFSPTTSGSMSGVISVYYGFAPGGREFNTSFNVSGIGVSALVFSGLQSISGVTHTSMTLNWSTLADAVGFNVLKIVGGSSVLVKVVPNTSGSVTQTTLTGLTPGTIYNYRVNGIDQLGSSDANVREVSQSTVANSSPVLTAIPNQTTYSGVTLATINASDSNTSGDTDADGDAITYTCHFDNSIDGIVLSTASSCTSLLNEGGGSPTFSASTGQFAGWKPRFVDEGTNFEFSITGTDPFGGTDSELFSTNIGVGVRMATDIADTSVDEDTSKSVSFQVFDGTGSVSCTSAFLSMTSSSHSVVLDSAVTWGGTYPNCTASIAPVANANGSSTISITVSNGSASSSDSFVLTVNSVNDLPTINNISNVTTTINSPVSVAFTITDVESSLDCTSSSLSLTSSAVSVLTGTNITWSGSSGSCQVTMVPVANIVGPTTVTITVTDGNAGTAADSFVLTVTPPAFSNAKTWLKADAGITMDGSNLVSAWADQSNSGNNAAASGAARPTWVDNVINGKPVLRGAESQFLTVTGLGTNWGTSVGSLFVVFQPNNDTQYGLLGFSGDATSFWRFTSGAGYFGTFRSARLGGVPASQPSTGLQMYTIISDTDRYVFYNKGNEDLGIAPGFGVPTDLTILKGDGGNFTGDVAEVLMYNSALTSAQRQNVECYLATKYGIAVSAYSCSNLAIVPSTTTVALNATKTMSAFGGQPPFSYSIVSGNGTIDSQSGVFTAPATGGESTVRLTDNLGSTSDAKILTVTSLPSSLANLRAWYDSTSFSLINGAKVSVWPDLSGNNFHAFSQTNTTLASFQNSVMNGFPVLRGLSSKLTANAVGTGWTGSDGTVVVAVHLTGDTQYGIMGFSGSGSTFWREPSTGKGYYGPFRANRFSGKPNVAMPVSGDYIFTVTTSASVYRAYLNGALILDDTADFGISSALTIFNEGGGGSLDGDIAELLLYNANLSDANRKSMECYLARKLNIATAITNSCN